MAKVLCVLYEHPVSGYPKTYARETIPTISVPGRPNDADARRASDFVPGELLGSVSGELGLRRFLEAGGHTLVVTSTGDLPRLCVRARAGRCRRRHLPTLLAGVPDGRQDRDGAQAEACHHGGDRV